MSLLHNFAVQWEGAGEHSHASPSKATAPGKHTPCFPMKFATSGVLSGSPPNGSCCRSSRANPLLLDGWIKWLRGSAQRLRRQESQASKHILERNPNEGHTKHKLQRHHVRARAIS